MNTDPAPPFPCRQAFPWRWALGGAGAGLLAAVVFHYVGLIVQRNFHELLPGIYRSAHLEPERLEQAVSRYGIRTIVNLRGGNESLDWYWDECRTTHRLNVSQEDIALSAGRLPSPSELRRLVRVLDRSEYPILIHCRHGADRTGLVSTLVLLLYTDAGMAEAERQLSLRYGHLPLGGPVYMSRFLQLYHEWLGREGLEHSPAGLRRWLEREYAGDRCQHRLEWLDCPDRLPPRRPLAVQVRAHNTSPKEWTFRSATGAGIHASYLLTDARGCHVAGGKVGLFDAVVRPGGSIDLSIPLPPLDEGRHFLAVDLYDRQHCWFNQLGAEPLVRELLVEE